MMSRTSTQASLTLPPAEAAMAGTESTMDTFLSIVNRLESTLDAESEALSRNFPISMGELNHRKRQGMLELGRVMRILPAGAPAQAVRDRLTTFSATIERNRHILDIHLRAVRDIAEIIAKTMRDADSDGTYSARAGRP